MSTYTEVVDVAALARDGAWDRDVPKGCNCPHAWHDGRWIRREGATCQVHTVGDVMAAATS